MKKLTLLLLLLISTNVMAELSSRIYDNMNQIEKDALKMYIQGLGEGSKWMIIFQEITNKEYKKVYCQPRQLGLNASNYVSILENRINKLKELNLPLEESFIGMDLINGLIDTFPCDKK